MVHEQVKNCIKKWHIINLKQMHYFGEKMHLSGKRNLCANQSNQGNKAFAQLHCTIWDSQEISGLTGVRL